MNTLIQDLQKIGWKDFKPGAFFDIQFESIGTAKFANNSWSILLQSLPALDAAAIETWNANYAHLLKKTPAGFFNAGKFFVLILLVETISPDGIAKLSQDGKLGFLEMPKSIFRGGGYTLMLAKDRGKIFMPQAVGFEPAMAFTEIARQTHIALERFAASALKSG